MSYLRANFLTEFLSSFKKEKNLISITAIFLKLLNVKVTASSIRDQLQFHPDYPSLLCLSDALNRWKVENAALHLTANNFQELTAPFITTLSDGTVNEFVIVSEIANEGVGVVNDTGQKRRLGVKDFLEKWSGTVLLAEADEASGEPDYKYKVKNERKAVLRLPLLIIVTIAVLSNILFSWNYGNGPLIAFVISNLSGLVISVVLSSIQLHADPEASMGICTFNEKTDCRKVLNSSASTVMGVSLSDVGLLFFLGNLCLLLMSGGRITSSYFSILWGLGMLSLPFTVFSVLYQWKVVKFWCVLCLAVQLILWVNFLLLNSFVDVSVNAIDVKTMISTTLAYMMLAVLWFTLKPVFEGAAQTQWARQHYFQLKNNKEIFSAYLRSQKPMPAYSGMLVPVSIGNPAAVHTITIITNPYCKPCSGKHEQLDNLLLTTSNIKVDVIFFVCQDVGPDRVRITKHLMALQREQKDVQAAIHDWYNQTDKNYDNWATNFPVSDLEACADQVDAHCAWCRNTGIQFTPTIFIDGYASPRYYEIEEIGKLLEHLDAC